MWSELFKCDLNYLNIMFELIKSCSAFCIIYILSELFKHDLNYLNPMFELNNPVMWSSLFIFYQNVANFLAN